MPYSADDFKLETWVDDLAGDGSLDPQEKQQLLNILGKDKVSPKIKSSVMRLPEYNRVMDEVSKLRKDIESKEAEVTDFQQELVNWKSDKEKKYNAVSDQKAAADRGLAELKAKLTKAAEDYGFNPEEYMPLAAKPSGKDRNDGDPPSKPPELDVSKYATKDELTIHPILAAELDDIRAEFQELFPGKTFKSRPFVEQALKNGQPVRKLVAEHFKFDERRLELDQQAKKANEDQIRADERQKVLSEQLLVNQNPVLTSSSSPVLSRVRDFSKAPDNGALARQNEGVLAAVNSFNEKRYGGKK